MKLRVNTFPSVPLLAMLLSSTSYGQGTPGADVTFQVPVNLTRLPAGVSRVKVWCRIEPGDSRTTFASFVGETELLVVQGSANQTVAVLVPVPAQAVSSASGETVSYRCGLQGLFAVVRTVGGVAVDEWHEFSSTGDRRLTPTPVNLTGYFVW